MEMPKMVVFCSWTVRSTRCQKMAVRSTQGQNRAVRSTQGGRGCHPQTWMSSKSKAWILFLQSECLETALSLIHTTIASFLFTPYILTVLRIVYKITAKAKNRFGVLVYRCISYILNLGFIEFSFYVKLSKDRVVFWQLGYKFKFY